ncbi:MAG TPA: tRNA (adenosine(37)-N6)-dimethylallyltransferase [Candidatus Azoamicus sp.]
MNDKVLFFLLGPTCVGKTNLSLRLFNYFPLEIINVDSSMIYKFMDIGTGKPCFNIRNKIKHHLVDIRTPLESYSVWDFCLDSFRAIFDCLNRNKIPLFVGGTMMYVWYLQNFFKSLNENLFFDSNLKSEFIYLNNKFKIRFSFINIFLLPFNKDIFYCKIRRRVWEMLDFGFLDEVIFLKSKMHLNLNCSSLKSIGYKDLWFYLDGKISFVDAVNSIFESTFKLADNQLKWSKKFSDNSFFIENKENFFLKKCIEIFNLYL